MNTKDPENESRRSLRAGETAHSAALNVNGQRAWWQVRGALWAALLFACAVSGVIVVDAEVRSASCTIVIRPLASSASTMAEWGGWVPLGLAAGVGTLAAAGLRRMRAERVFPGRTGDLRS